MARDPEAVVPDLTYLAQSAARFFLSLELAHDAGPLTRLGNGQLRLDLRQMTARHEHSWFPMPHMGHRLRHRIGVALMTAELALEDLARLEVEAAVKLTVVPRTDAVSMRGINWCGVDGPLVRYDAAVTTRLALDGQLFEGRHSGTMFWPESMGRASS